MNVKSRIEHAEHDWEGQLDGDDAAIAASATARVEWLMAIA
jgi:hypothetical protein